MATLHEPIARDIEEVGHHGLAPRPQPLELCDGIGLDQRLDSPRGPVGDVAADEDQLHLR